LVEPLRSKPDISVRFRTTHCCWKLVAPVRFRPIGGLRIAGIDSAEGIWKFIGTWVAAFANVMNSPFNQTTTGALKRL